MVKTINITDKGGRWVHDEAKAERVIGFFEDMLPFVEGERAGEPFRLQDWQKNLLSNAFGWVDAETGRRRFRYIYLEIPKKNGKTSLAAGISLYLAFADGEKGAKVYFAAGSQDQANIGYDIAKNMVEMSEDLDEVLKAYKKSIWRKGNEMNYVKSLSKSVGTKHGLNVHGVVYDEMHAAPNKELFETLEKGISARSQPMVVGITTAGYAIPGNLGWDMHNYALSVIKGEIEDDRFLPVIYTAGKESDPYSVDAWKEANPNLMIPGGKAFEYMEDQANKAKRSKSDLATFKRLDLNIWTSETSDDIPVDQWLANERYLTFQELAEYKCWLGLDLSSSRDFTCCGAMFEIEPGKRYYFKPTFWIPDKNLPTRPASKQIKAWIKDGWAYGCRGQTIDYDQIFDFIVWCYENLNVQDTFYDPWNANQLTSRLEKEEGIELKECRQGYKTMSPLYKNWEKMTIEGQFEHDGNPVMGWQLNNLVLKQDYNGNFQPDKKNSLDTIDGAVACLMSTKGILEEEEKQEPTPRVRSI